MFFIVRPTPQSQGQPSYPNQAAPSPNLYKTHSDMLTENEDAEDDQLRRRRSVKHRGEPPNSAQGSNDGDILFEIGECIKNLKAEKAILRAENAQLTEDIRKMDALRKQQAALEADMEQIVEGMYDRHARIERPHRIAMKKAKAVRKKAEQIEEERGIELQLAEGIMQPYIETDEDGRVLLMQEHGNDIDKERFFDAYTDVKSSYDSLHAAITRLRQSRAELLNLSDFVSKVQRIAIGDVYTPHDRLFTLPRV